MAKQLAKMLFVAPVLVASFFALNAFTKAPGKDIVTGGGFTTEGQHFNLNAVATKGGTVGHVQFDGMTYEVACVVVDNTTATIYLEEGTKYITVVDKGEGKDAVDQISAVLDVLDPLTVCEESITPEALYNVQGGNIQVHIK